MNARRLRAALHQAVDLVLDALEEAPTPAERHKVRRVTRPAPLPPAPQNVPLALRAKVEHHLQRNGYDIDTPK